MAFNNNVDEGKETNLELILVIEDDKLFHKTLVAALKRQGLKVYSAYDGPEALKLVKDTSFNLIVSDIRLPSGMDGIEVLQKIRQTETGQSKMILMTGYADKEAPVRAIRLGVDDYIYKPFQLDEFLHSVKKSLEEAKLQKALNRFKELSNRDGLTNLYNHRYFYEILERELVRSLRYSHPMALFLIDIDNFKHFNDTYGHLAGDIILRKISEIFTSTLRSVDYIFRYGGEEFCVILPETNKEGGLKVAGKIREIVEKTSFEYREGEETKLSVSIGVASYPDDTKLKEELISFADQALYKAKRAGRNLVCAWEKESQKN